MKITIDEPTTSLQQVIIENIEKDEVSILETILEILELQHDYFQVQKYYANNLRELVAFDRIRTNDN